MVVHVLMFGEQYEESYIHGIYSNIEDALEAQKSLTDTMSWVESHEVEVC